jgi:hypothetical protein
VTTYQGVAAVTQTFRYLVESAARAVVPEVTTTTESPQANPAAARDEPRISVSLLQVTPDPSKRSEDLPRTAPDGTLVHTPRVALDLRYIVTFLGPAPSAQLMLGAVEVALRERTFLDPALVTDALFDHPKLQGSQLERQRPPVMLSPLPWDLEQFSRMWSSFFQLPYKLSILYQATGLVLESALPPVAYLPVRSPGLSHAGRPRVLHPLAPVDWAPDAVVPVSGSGLSDGDILDVGGRDAALFGTGTGLAFRLPEETRAGIVGVRTRSGDGRAFGTTQTLAVRPRLVSAEVRERHVVAEVEPGPQAGQALGLALFSLETGGGASARTTTVVSSSGSTVEFRLPDVPSGSYVAMIEVDGVSSIPVFENGRYDRPTVDVR